MAKNISRHQGREEPVKGKRTGKVVLRAEFFLTKAAAALPETRKRALLRGKKEAAKEVIRTGIRKEYKRSGLKVRSGKLLRAALKFKLDFQVRRDRIIVIVTWSPKLAYFFAHLFGVKIRITAKMRVFLHANDIIHPRDSTKFVNIPRRNFLSLRKQVRTGIAGKVLRPAFADEMKAQAEKVKLRETKQRARRAARELSAFRARREGLTPEQARQLRRAERLVTQAEEVIARLGPISMREAR